MKIEVEGQEILVKDIKYGQKLELLGHYQDVLKPVHENTGEISQREFNTLLGHVSEIAFNNAEKDLKSYAYDVQIKILTQTLLDYLGLSLESKKEDGG